MPVIFGQRSQIGFPLFACLPRCEAEGEEPPNPEFILKYCKGALTIAETNQFSHGVVFAPFEVADVSASRKWRPNLRTPCPQNVVKDDAHYT